MSGPVPAKAIARLRGPIVIPGCKSRMAAQWLRDHPECTISHAARIHDCNPGAVYNAWGRMFGERIGLRNRGGL